MTEHSEQPGQSEQGTAVAAAAEPPVEIDEARAWLGFRLDETSGSAVGKVLGLYVDEKTGSVEWLQARMGRFGHHSLVPARDAVAGISRVWVPYSRAEIRAAPRIRQGEGLTREREREFLAHYGIATEATGRGAELSGRGPAEITVRPLG